MIFFFFETKKMQNGINYGRVLRLNLQKIQNYLVNNELHQLSVKALIFILANCIWFPCKVSIIKSSILFNDNLKKVLRYLFDYLFTIFGIDNHKGTFMFYNELVLNFCEDAVIKSNAVQFKFLRKYQSFDIIRNNKIFWNKDLVKNWHNLLINKPDDFDIFPENIFDFKLLFFVFGRNAPVFDAESILGDKIDKYKVLLANYNENDDNNNNNNNNQIDPMDKDLESDDEKQDSKLDDSTFDCFHTDIRGDILRYKTNFQNLSISLSDDIESDDTFNLFENDTAQLDDLWNKLPLKLKDHLFSVLNIIFILIQTRRKCKLNHFSFRDMNNSEKNQICNALNISDFKSCDLKQQKFLRIFFNFLLKYSFNNNKIMNHFNPIDFGIDTNSISNNDINIISNPINDNNNNNNNNNNNKSRSNLSFNFNPNFKKRPLSFFSNPRPQKRFCLNNRKMIPKFNPPAGFILDQQNENERYDVDEQIQIIKQNRFKSITDIQWLDVNNIKDIVVITGLANNELLSNDEKHIYSQIMNSANNVLSKLLES